MKFQPDFQRFSSAALCKETDRVPLADRHIDKVVKEALLGRKINTLQDEIDFSLKAGYDFVMLSPNYFIPETRLAAEQHNVAFDSGKREWANESEGAILDDEDYDKFPWPAFEELDFTPFDEIKELLPPGMKVIGQGHNILALAWRLMGFETFSIAMVENPELIEKIVSRLGELQVFIAKKALAYEHVGAFWHADDIAYGTGLLFSPAVLHTLLFPYMKEMASMCHKRGLPFLYHTDGNVLQVIDDLIALGVDALHPIEPNAMDIVALKKQYGGKLALVGGIDVDLLSRGTPEQIDELVKNMIADVAPGGGYLVGSSNSVPNYVPLANYEALLHASIKYGKNVL